MRRQLLVISLVLGVLQAYAADSKKLQVDPNLGSSENPLNSPTVIIFRSAVQLYVCAQCNKLKNDTTDPLIKKALDERLSPQKLQKPRKSPKKEEQKSEEVH